MQQIFTNEEAVNDIFTITGQDAHHLKRVVRLKIGEKIRVSSIDNNYLCQIDDFVGDDVLAKIIEVMPCTELSNKIYLFQAVPKGDRMETIIEKCVELGVYEIIPVEMKNCIVKLDEKKKSSKLSRYNSIAKSAAEQSKRSMIPKVSEFMSYKQAVEYANKLDINILPFESKNGMQDTFDVLKTIKPDSSVGIFIGPEGGFDASEITIAENNNFSIISLGKRILRTDTAAITSLSMLMLYSEVNNDLF